MTTNQIIKSILIWRLKNISNHRFLLILSVIVGVFSGLAAIILKNTAYYTHYFVTNNFDFHEKNYFYLIYPFIGIGLTALFVRYIIKDNIGHGVSKVLYAISKKGGKIKSHNNYSSVIASTLTVSFGGSVGLEAPIVYTGSSIGSTLGQLCRLNYKNITLLIGCGTAAGIAGIFKAPIAGVIFVIEVLMLDLTMSTLLPLMIASITASLVSYYFMGNGVLFTFKITSPFYLSKIPYFIILGITSGFVSLYFMRFSMWIEKVFQSIHSFVLRIIIGSALVGVLIFIFPSLYGEGYDILTLILNGKGDVVFHSGILSFTQNDSFYLILILVLILFVKIIAMSATTGGGGIGGVFAPSLFMGGITGLLVAKLLNSIGITNISDSNFALVGMAGVMAGVMHSPLTAIFLIAEITGGYVLLPPLIITSVISYLTIYHFEPHSIYSKRLAVRGELMTHHKDKAVLSLMKIDKLIESNFNTIYPDATLGDLVKLISKSTRNIFPVVGNDNFFIGLVAMDDIRSIIFDTEKYDTTLVVDLMIYPKFYVDYEDTMEIIAHKFNKSGNYNLPVLKDGKYLGFVSRANTFLAYRKMNKDFSED